MLRDVTILIISAYMIIDSLMKYIEPNGDMWIFSAMAGMFCFIVHFASILKIAANRRYAKEQFEKSANKLWED